MSWNLIDYESVFFTMCFHYFDGAVFFHDMFWFMAVSPRIVDGSIRCSCRHMRIDAKNPVTTARSAEIARRDLSGVMEFEPPTWLELAHGARPPSPTADSGDGNTKLPAEWRPNTEQASSSLVWM